LIYNGNFSLQCGYKSLFKLMLMTSVMSLMSPPTPPTIPVRGQMQATNYTAYTSK